MYCTRADIEMRFGVANVRMWADLDNKGDAAAITARIDWAIAEAQDFVDNKLRGGEYAVPFATAPRMITSITARLAGCMLYELRANDDSDPESDEPIDRLSTVRNKAEKQLGEIYAGDMLLDTPRVDSFLPSVVPVTLKQYPYDPSNFES